MNLKLDFISKQIVPALKSTALDSLPKGEAPPVSPRRRVLLLIGPNRDKAPKLCKRLLGHGDWEVTVHTLSAGFHLHDELLRSDIVVCPGLSEVIRSAVAACCPLIVSAPSQEMRAGLSFLSWSKVGAIAERPREVEEWIVRAFRDRGALLTLWRRNLSAYETLGDFPFAPPPARELAHLRTIPAARVSTGARQLVLCDLHTHSTWSDGKLTVPELVDFYGTRGFDCLSVTDHLCDPRRSLGKLVNLTGMAIPPRRLGAYFQEIEREKKRALKKYGMHLLTGIEFNKDGYTSKSSAHLLGIDLQEPIDPALEIEALISAIHEQGGLAVASHPHEMKSEWGKNTLYLWQNREKYAPLLDAWEIANRDDIFNPVGLNKLPFIANSDFHKPRHIHSWKTVLFCEKDPEAIKECIRLNRDVSIVLYRGQRFAGNLPA